jgi:competence protein ComGC
MRFFETKKAFTLMEVNLAIFIMAVGLLAMVALYPLAYRESRQSQDDVKAAAAADCVLNTLTATLSSRNIKWEDWERGIRGAIQSKGWLDYCDKTQNSYAPKKRSEINSLAKNVFGKLTDINKDGNKPPWPVTDELACAIVVQWGQIPIFNGTTMHMENDYSRVAICLRTTRRAGDLFAQPIFYTEVHFQGDQEQLKE